MQFKDYYAVLEVSPEASSDEIKRAYRKLARKTHPDLNAGPEAEAAFKEVNEAYEALKTPESRAEYDAIRSGATARPGASSEWQGGYTFDEGNPETQARFNDFFASAFGRGDPFGSAGAVGDDIHARVVLDIEDSYRSPTRLLTIPVRKVTPEGRVRIENRELSVRIPKGIAEGQNIRLAGQGSGDGSRDIYLEVAFAPHPIYRAEGRDIFMDLPVAPWEAALGGNVVLPTPGGKVDLKIPPNARTGQKLRLKGKGLPGRPAGNLVANLVIVNPNVTSEEARDLFAQMARDLPFDPRRNLGRKS